MTGASTLEFDDSNFEAQVLQAKTPVLVDFGAEWCGPCQVLAPVIEDLATEYAGKVAVGKMDIDKSVRTASKYSVQNIPTVMIFRDGQPIERIVGLRNKSEYKRVLDAQLA